MVSKRGRAIIAIVVLILIGMYVFFIYHPFIKNLYVQEHVVGTGNIKGDVDKNDFIKKDNRFEIGADKNGYAVFKNPREAYKALIEKYSKGFELIKRETGVKPTPSNYDKFNFGLFEPILDVGTKEEQEQVTFISEFMDIYANSFVDNSNEE